MNHKIAQIQLLGNTNILKTLKKRLLYLSVNLLHKNCNLLKSYATLTLCSDTCLTPTVFLVVTFPCINYRVQLSLLFLMIVHVAIVLPSSISASLLWICLADTLPAARFRPLLSSVQDCVLLDWSVI